MLGSLKKTGQFYFRGIRTLRKSTPYVRNNRMLLVQNSGLGDVCQFIPIARRLEEYGCVLDVAAPSPFEPLYLRFVRPNRFLALPPRGRWSDDISRLLRDKSYEAVFAVSMNREAARAAAATGCPNRYGMVENRRYYMGSRLFFSNTLHVDARTHVSERYRELFRLHIPDFDTGGGGDTGGAVKPAGSSIVIHPGGKWPPRRWSAVGYLDLARELVRGGARVTVMLHRSEPELVSFFRGRTLPAGVSLHQIETMQTLMDVVQSCSYFVGNDSGPAHLANLFGIPLTVIWGPGNLERIRPLGPNVQILSVDIPCRPCRQYIHPVLCENGTNDCLLNISVDDVLQAVHRHRDEKQWHSFAT